MKKKLLALILAGAMAATMLMACGGSSEEASTEEEYVEEESEEETSGEMVSDETFAALQENYGLLNDSYTIVYEYYMSDGVEADAEIEALLEEAASIIETMGAITQDSMTEEDAVSLSDSMLTVMEGLSVIIDAM